MKFSRLQKAAFALVLSAAALATVAPGMAQPTEAQRSAIRSACRSDYMSNCSSVTPGGAEALQCLQRNEAKLSSSCLSAVNAISAKPEPAAAEAPKPAPAPGAAPAAATKPATAPAKPTTAAAPPASAQGAAPAKRPVTGIKPAAPAPAAAVTGPPPAPPPLPVTQIPPRFELQVVRSCRAEVRTICALPAGGGRILNCLAANQLQVSPSCSLAIDRARAAAR
jgi:hypothetical protein